MRCFLNVTIQLHCLFFFPFNSSGHPLHFLLFRSFRSDTSYSYVQIKCKLVGNDWCAWAGGGQQAYPPIGLGHQPNDIKLHKAKWVQHSCYYSCLFPCSLLTVQSESFILNFIKIFFYTKGTAWILLMRQSSFDDLLGNLKVVFSNLDSPLGSFNERWSREHFKVFVCLMLQLWLNIDHLHKWDTCSVGSCTGA